MIRFVKLNRVQLLEGAADLEALKSAPHLFCDDAALARELKAFGVSSKEIPGEGVPDNAIVVLGSHPLYDLVYVSDRLLGPGGCPWDKAQTHESLKRYLLEESYELFEAIDSGSDEKLKEELGDVLLQPIMHAEMKKIAGGFDIDDVANAVVDKLVRRHPHVFGNVTAETTDDVLRNWDSIKRSERETQESILSGIPRAMPALLRALEVSKRAVRAGFEWPDIESVFDKLHEEEAELIRGLGSGDQAHIEAEIGDLLFTVVNLARWSKVEPEEALRKMLDRFTARFALMEQNADKPLTTLSPEEWDALWNDAKAAER